MRAKTLSCWHKYLDECPPGETEINAISMACCATVGFPQIKIVCQQIRGIPFECFLDPAACLEPGARWVNS